MEAEETAGSNRTFMELKLEMYCQIPRQPFRPF